MAESLGPITMAMLKHHRIINKMLDNFEKILAKAKKSADVFDIFRKNLEKHFFIEEVNVFPVTDRTNNAEFLQFQNLLRDHKDLREVVKNIYEEIVDEGESNVKILKELLFAHERREIESFYPRFDKRLSKEEQKEILKKVNETKLG